MDPRTIAAYNRDASRLAERYESVEGGLARFFPLVFSAGRPVLDVGAGSGRDLAVLSRLGCHAWGIEPAAELREHALRLHPELAGRIVDGALPNRLDALAGRSFDGITLSAILMHIPEEELFDSALALRHLLNPGGVLLISISTRRGDVQERSGRDGFGRLFVTRDAASVQLLFERVGFVTESRWDSADALGRSDTEWVTLLFRYAGGAPRPIDRVVADLSHRPK